MAWIKEDMENGLYVYLTVVSEAGLGELSGYPTVAEPKRPI
jgi:hypothetical protein